jgi:hypothetical protein
MMDSKDHPTKPSDLLQNETMEKLDREQRTAVFLVGGEHRLEPATLGVFRNLYAKEYQQILFISVGVYDYEVMDAGVAGGGYADPEKGKHLRLQARLALDPYLTAAHEMGLAADCRVTIATDPVEEIDRMSTEIAALYPRTVFFLSKLVYRRFNWLHRLLRAGTSDAIQKRLEKKGLSVTVISLLLPV